MKKNKDLYMANMIRRAALKNHVHGHNVWGEEEYDPKMLKMYCSDYLDLMRVAWLLENKQYTKASHKLWDMDTGAREKCPTTTWNYIEKKANPED